MSSDEMRRILTLLESTVLSEDRRVTLEMLNANVGSNPRLKALSVLFSRTPPRLLEYANVKRGGGAGTKLDTGGGGFPPYDGGDDDGGGGGGGDGGVYAIIIKAVYDASGLTLTNPETKKTIGLKSFEVSITIKDSFEKADVFVKYLGHDGAYGLSVSDGFNNMDEHEATYWWLYGSDPRYMALKKAWETATKDGISWDSDGEDGDGGDHFIIVHDMAERSRGPFKTLIAAGLEIKGRDDVLSPLMQFARKYPPANFKSRMADRHGYFD